MRLNVLEECELEMIDAHKANIRQSSYQYAANHLERMGPLGLEPRTKGL
jgi:hypothetical protein